MICLEFDKRCGDIYCKQLHLVDSVGAFYKHSNGERNKQIEEIGTMQRVLGLWGKWAWLVILIVTLKFNNNRNKARDS